MSKRRISRVASACVLGFLLTGCTFVGPKAIRSGRLAYNDAITETNNQQMLMVAVNNRYTEGINLLAVASVTANVRVSTSTGVELGFGDSENYAGNLVPFSFGAIYEENPTISYVPVAGTNYFRQVMSPIPVAVLAQLTRTLTRGATVYSALVSNINGISNPDFLFSETEADPRFGRLVALIEQLTRANRLEWVEDPQRADSFSIVIDHYAPDYAAEVDELLDLLGLPAPDDRATRVVLPVFLALDGRRRGGIGINTRSVFRLVEILSAAIEVPEEDRASGVTANYPPLGALGQALRVRRADDRPARAQVAVEHRDGWFYIDETDLATKSFFRLLSSLWSIIIAESATSVSAAPVLTVPVSR